MSIIDSPLYSVSSIREMESFVFTEFDSFEIMKQAGEALAVSILNDISPCSNPHIYVFLGKGNNAGDALIAATYLQKKGFGISLIHVFDLNYQGDALQAYHLAQQCGLEFSEFNADLILNNQDIIIDGLLGIGLTRLIDGSFAQMIHFINESNAHRIYAVDVPSGIDADTGRQLGDCSVQATDTITFLADKIGLHTHLGKTQSGRVSVCIPVSNYLSQKHQTELLLSHDKLLVSIDSHSQLPANAHKGFFGHALFVGSGKNSDGVGMFGAGALAAISGLKVGAGKSSLYSHPDYHQQFVVNQLSLYEVMKCDAFSNLSHYTAIGLGMGLGKEHWGKQQLYNLINELSNQSLELPILIDADGLFHLKQLKQEGSSFSPDIITPHEAEAAHLLSISLEELVTNKPFYVKQLAKKYQCIAILKGLGTLISDGLNTWINSSGHVSLATAGTGDVLSGMIVGLMARGDTPLVAAQKAVYWHGKAADYYQEESHLCDKSMMARDIWNYL